MTKGETAAKLRDDGASYESIAAHLGMSSAKSARRLVSEYRTTPRRPPPTAAEAVEWGRKFEGMARTRPKFTFRDLYFSGDEPGPTLLPGKPCTGYEPPKKTTHLIIPDTQIKPESDPSPLYWAGRYVAERQPDVVVHLGDHWDMSSLSSYEKPGSKFFEGRRYLEDIEAGNRALELFEKGLGSYRPKRKILLRGNHEDRITRAINSDPKLEGLIGYHQFNDVSLGWDVQDYLVPIDIDGISYAHYYYQPLSGRPYGGTVDAMLRNIGHSFTQGHVQGLKWGRRELPNGTVQIGLVAGSYYLGEESYRGPQAKSEWRGLVAKHEVQNGTYDPMMVSLNWLSSKFKEN